MSRQRTREKVVTKSSYHMPLNSNEFTLRSQTASLCTRNKTFMRSMADEWDESRMRSIETCLSQMESKSPDRPQIKLMHRYSPTGAEKRYKVARRHSEATMQRNSKMLNELKNARNAQRFIDLSQISVQQRLDLKFDKVTLEKFNQLKNQTNVAKSDATTTAWVDQNSDEHFVVDVGSGGQVMQIDRNKAFYVGGRGVNFKKGVILLQNKGTPGDSQVKSRPFQVKTQTEEGKTIKKDVRIKLGREGHTAVFSKRFMSIFLFAGRQEREGNNLVSKDILNDIYRIDLIQGSFQKMPLTNQSLLQKRTHACGFMVSEFFFAVGGFNVNGDCLGEIVMMDVQKQITTKFNRDTHPQALHQFKPLGAYQCVAAFYGSRYSNSGIDSQGNSPALGARKEQNFAFGSQISQRMVSY